jgi:hypothetical protein
MPIPNTPPVVLRETARSTDAVTLSETGRSRLPTVAHSGQARVKRKKLYPVVKTQLD